MLKYLLNKTLFITLVFLNINGYSQSMLAGIHSLGEYYKDIVPDTTIKSYNGYADSLLLDIDNDNIIDLKILTYASVGQAGGTWGCLITPKTFYCKIATFAGFNCNIVDTIQINDTISNKCTFSDGTNYMWSGHFGFGTAPTVNTWDNIGEHFIGVQLSYLNDTIYGWIRVEVASFPNAKGIIIKDYAASKEGVPNFVISNNSKIIISRIFPNPVLDKLTIESEIDIKRISILDYTGKVLKHFSFSSHTINVADLTSGIYFIKLIGEEQTIIEKFVKK